MHVSDEGIEAAAMESWDALISNNNPLKAWGLMVAEQPDFVAAHKKHVTALFTHDFNLGKSIPAASGGKYTFEELTKTGKEFQHRLAEYLREWARRVLG